KFKIGIAFLMTTRGIPMIYYGTEILMKNFADPDGKVREDFPGGWKDDPANKFVRTGRSDTENEAYDFIKRLTTWRKETPVVQTGKLTQFVPEKGVYVYFRHNEDRKVMIILNTCTDERTLSMKKFAAQFGNIANAADVLTGKKLEISGQISLKGYSLLILELK
ncbi:MAG: cyclomaltodextrinase C-terminal domain-containing protein, partial [Bacteroidetes bacterium]|nr:cyclomaltodextrinase C-terminal domain-containing protein [Bacteroidota bacterium]